MFKKITKNTLYLFFSEALAKLVIFFWTVYIARKFSIEAFGNFNLINSYMLLFMFLTDLGIGLILIREMSQERKKIKKLLGNYLTLNLVMSMVTTLAIIISFALWRGSGMLPIIVFASINFFFAAIRSPILVLLQGLERMGTMAVFNGLNVLLPSLLSFIAVYFSPNLLSLFMGLALGMILSTFSLWTFAFRQFFVPKIIVNFSTLKNLLGQSWPLATAAFLGMVQARVDNLLLVQFLTAGALGVYSVASIFPQTAISLVGIPLATAVYPPFAKMRKRQPSQFWKRFKNLMTVSLLLTIIISLVTIAISDSIIPLLYSQKYAPASRVLKVLIWYINFFFLNRLFYQTLIILKKEKVYLAVNILGASVNVLFNILFIGRLGILGAAWARLGSEALLTSVYTIHFFKNKQSLFLAGARNRVKYT